MEADYPPENCFKIKMAQTFSYEFGQILELPLKISLVKSPSKHNWEAIHAGSWKILWHSEKQIKNDPN